jgi:hypothetical protein
MSMERTQLVLREDAQRARAEISDHLSRGERGNAEGVMATYHPETQALIVRTAFVDELELYCGSGSYSDAVRRAGQAVEDLIDLIPSEDVEDAVASLDPQVLGAALSARAGEEVSSAVELISPERFEELLASDLEAWTVGAIDEQIGEMERLRSINTDHLTMVLWTALQTDDERAFALLEVLNLDLVAYCVSDQLGSGYQHGDLEEVEPSEEADDLQANIRSGLEDGPDALAIADMNLVDLLHRIMNLSRTRYGEILHRARTMDRELVSDELQGRAADLAVGEAQATSADFDDDDMFVSLEEVPETDGLDTSERNRNA